MKHTLTALIGFTFFIMLPLFGQSRQLVDTYRPANVLLLYFGEDGKSVLGQLQALARTDEFVEVGLELSLAPSQSQPRYYAALKKELGADQNAAWILADSKGFLLAQGNATPDAETISQALEKSGIRSPIKVLREFIKSHPGHLDAKSNLLSWLRSLAEIRTIKLLQLDIKTLNEIKQISNWEWLFRAFETRPSVDVSVIGDRQLEDTEDLEIWGGYAQELNSLFSSGDWRLIKIFSKHSLSAPAEAASPLMKGIYRHFAPQVLEALQEQPRNKDLWWTYLWMRRVGGIKNPIQSVLSSIVPSPTHEEWPPEEVYAIFEEEAREQNRWNDLADLLWDQRFDYIGRQHSLHHSVLSIERASQPTDITDSMAKEFKGSYFNPLLEALIKTSRIDDAEFIITNFGRLHHLSNLPKEAASLATKSGRPDLAARWSNLQIQIKSDAMDTDDEFENYLYLLTKEKPRLFMIYGENEDPSKRPDISRQIDNLRETMILHGWDINAHLLYEYEAKSMIRHQNLYKNETMWLLFGLNKRALLSGKGMPSADDIIRGLELGNIKKTTELLRSFIREHPNQIDAKEELAGFLKKIALENTRKSKKIKNGDGDFELSPDDDYIIWGEYASLLRQLLHYYSNNNPYITHIHGIDAGEADEISKSSPLMRALARDLLPSVSDNILKMPVSINYWSFWHTFSDPTSSTQFAALMDAITHSPMFFNGSLDFSRSVPPQYVLPDLLSRYKINSNWQGIVNVFDQLLGNSRNYDDFLPRFRYDADPKILIEAYINLNQEGNLMELLDALKRDRYTSRDKAAIEKLFEQYGRVLR